MFVTDDRSTKCVHLSGTAHGEGGRLAPVECCWWLDEAAVQFRISGHAVLATARSDERMLREAVHEVWARLGASARRTFFWPHPGAPRVAHDVKHATPPSADEPSLDASHFVLVVVIPDAVDELHLGRNQRRCIYQREGERFEHPGSDGEANCSSTPLSTLQLLASACNAKWTLQEVNP